jgi:hypothetical protein
MTTTNNNNKIIIIIIIIKFVLCIIASIRFLFPLGEFCQIVKGQMEFLNEF